MKYVTAFFMAWGNFLTIPCPLKKWDSKLNNWMLAFLPLIGLIIGGIWALGILFLRYLNQMIELPEQVGAFLAMCIPFLLCGMFHLDGFMDVTDAILSRRDLPERQRILKDPTVGSFAVIAVVFLLLAWYAAISGLWKDGNILAFVVIPAVSRASAGADVLTRRPIGASQYSYSFEDEDKKRTLILLAAQTVVIVICTGILGRGNMTALIIVVAAAALLFGAYARNRLGGMNGDIAGAMICISEITGLLIWSMIL